MEKLGLIVVVGTIAYLLAAATGLIDGNVMQWIDSVWAFIRMIIGG